ncbi:GGDEF domain-containing protein [Mycobacterium shigaense]|uniref:GGDEF domain-containing protein n=1 Tax=Mycobacterium shigaense TaxID=722731 RepID=UPI000D40277F|nr:GGDEF domain-containing protein [Mycobacterium shigaense]MEA1123757.1 GGDEF domain-containing protein [Mycobacterium shigaense]PRI12823.1 GGDEF domain-containing protein [Mycobacterium shigaense]
MTCHVGPQPSVGRWHAIGLTAFLWMLFLYAVKAYSAGTKVDSRISWLLGAAALLAAVVAVVGRLRDWQQRRVLLFGWPAAALIVTTLVGAMDSYITRDFPGNITMTFAYIGLTCRRWRSLAFLPLGLAAFVIGGARFLPANLTTVVLTTCMWVIVAEVPAWLIARLEEQSELLREIARTDTLTRLLNRSTLAAELSTHADRCAVVLIDLDSFKSYNDHHGHEAGDRLLVDFADALRWSARPQDIVFRIGGDEFLVLLVGAGRADAEQARDRLRRRWAETGGPVDFSAGIAAGAPDLMRLADERMYADKRSRGLAAD